MEPVNHQHVPQRRSPSLTSTSETLAASSDVSFPSTQSLSRDQVTTARNTRKLVINSSVTSPPQTQPIRRKPLSSTASPIVSRYSSGAYLGVAKDLQRPEQRYSRSFSLDSPTVYEFPLAIRQKSPVLIELPPKTVAHRTPARSEETLSILEEFPLPMQSDQTAEVGEAKRPRSPDHHDNPAAPQTVATAGLTQPDDLAVYENPLPADAEDDHLSVLDGYDSDSSVQSNYNNHNPNPVAPTENMSLFVNRKPAPPNLTLNQANPEPHESTTSPTHNNNHEVKTPNTDKPLPKSPGSSKLGTFFSWGSPSASTSEFSPLPSPYGPKSSVYTDASPVTTIRPESLLEAPKGPTTSREYSESYLDTPANILPSHPAEIEEMEEELKAISGELASSIRREMDLEDLVDRLQAERDNPISSSNKRTSDYFSDSGYSSTKFSDYDQSREEVERIQRRAEQEMAQVRLELTNKLQDERTKRQQLDDQIKDLSQRASQIDLEALSNADDSDRVKELENTCETLRRKLTEERQVKDNFEDLLAVLKDELQNAANERDNLRDEVVPQLRARVEGLEAQATDLEKMSYESTKMQQELQSLKSENTSLKQEKEERSIGSIAEESSRLSRSSSLTGPPPSFRLQRPPSISRPPSLSRSASLSRSKSVKTTESRDALSDRLKDVEEQRDALHRALKALLERQECQNRENERKIRTLETERERLLSGSPQKAGFVKEVSNLREEINVLRRRSEEALEQRWQVEKGLAGIKMDLDRAEQEISSLRSLLDEKDILIPENLSRSSAGSDSSYHPVTSDSLREAYRGLQEAYAESLERIQSMDPSSSSDEKTKLAIERLEQSLSSAVSERDLALQEVSSYKAQLDALKSQEQTYLESEKTLADELHESARRVEELALQVRQQLAANQNLRQRLTDTVARGEAAQKANAEHITALQARLRTLEEQVVAAQTASEERVSRHEDELLTLRESHSQQLSRFSSALSPRSPRAFPPKSPMSPLFSGAGAKSPRLEMTRSGSAMTVAEETQVTSLREKVAALEKALAEADDEMQEVVSRMNTAQIEVLGLQEEREAAVNQARKLEKALQAEKVRAFEDKFKTLQQV
ncbi:hypothetical protein PG999_013598 [Apiospora kogelbergensis]|uniref:DUF7603 domain-containing protein n=1 Tax=Apiospora kogelbergensis TaxID=1337665 RepID=A0AAW0Q6H1_9PEZI